ALNVLFRFDQPGKFRLYVTSPRILKYGGYRFGELDVTSNIVEFEILPYDAKWAEQQQADIKKTTALRDRTLEYKAALRRLRFLNTTAAASEIVRRYVGPSADGEDDQRQYTLGLIGSPHREFVIEEMERRLVASDQGVSRKYLDTL